LLAQIEARWPEWNLPYLIHGIVLTIRLRSRQAEGLLETAIALGADNPLAYYYLALALTHDDPLGNIQRAEEAIGRALKLNPENAFTQALAGKIAYLRKDYPSAAEYLQAALRIWPNMVEAHQTLSSVYRAVGDKQKSIAELKEVLRIKHENRGADQAPPFPASDLLFTIRPPSRATM
jgi:tetratricopeptide (TPR) repeat protein